MTRNQKILFALFFVGMIFCLQNRCYAGTQKLNSLHYDVQLNENGDMEVVETWDIEIRETNTVFKDFDLDKSKYSGITNVKVKDLDTELALSKIDEEMYHVTKGCYYGLPVSNGKFEIAWGVGLDNSSARKQYEISYTVENVVSVYQDCSELYWQFIGINNGMSAKKITGTIKLPQAVLDLESLRVWAHGPLNGEISRISKDAVKFEIEDLEPQTMLEVRVVVEEPIFSKSIRNSPQRKLEEIIVEETEWANQANRKRRKAKAIFIGIAVIYIVIFLFFGKKVLRYWKEMKSFPKNPYQIEIGKYFRDIPREKDATPADAAFLYYLKLKGKENYIISATLLQLCLKGYISFEKEGKKDIRIHLLKPMDNALKKTERLVYGILTWPAGVSKEKTVTMEQIEKCMQKHYDKCELLMNDLRDYAKEAQEECQNYDLVAGEQASRYTAKSMIYIMVTIGCGLFLAPISMLLAPIILEWIISAILLSKTAKRIPVLTEQGEIEKQQWAGLKNYMEDFSLLKDKEIPDLVLWEKYLVYATVFGISDKVVKQLKVVYPQMENLDNRTYTYLYLMSDTRFANGFIGDLNKSTNSAYSAYKSAYSAAHSSSSSGSGSGGGFSSGGGGRWRRRSEWADAKDFKKEKKMKIGIDIGGSHIGVGIVDTNGKIIEKSEKRLMSAEKQDVEKAIETYIVEQTNDFMKKYKIIGMGLSVPGTVSHDTIIKASNLGFENYEIVKKLQEKIKLPIKMRNDAKCAAIAEDAYGLLKKYKRSLFFTLGTGIGGAVIIEHKLLDTGDKPGCEVGHMAIEKNGKLCKCGKKGCWQQYASMKALKDNLRKELGYDETTSGEDLLNLIKNNKQGQENYEKIEKILEEYIEDLSIGICNLVNIFEPEAIGIGGSFVYFEEVLLQRLKNKILEKTQLFNEREDIIIETAILGNDAGMIGAVIE